MVLIFFITYCTHSHYQTSIGGYLDFFLDLHGLKVDGLWASSKLRVKYMLCYSVIATRDSDFEREVRKGKVFSVGKEFSTVLYCGFDV